MSEKPQFLSNVTYSSLVYARASLWVYLSYDINPIEEFKKRNPTEEIFGMRLRIRYDKDQHQFEDYESQSARALNYVKLLLKRLPS